MGARSSARRGAGYHRHGKPIARIEGIVANTQVNPFRQRQLRPGYAKLRGKLGGGADSALIVSDDRDGR